MAVLRDLRSGIQGLGPFFYEAFSKPVGVISPVGKQPIRLWRAVLQGSCVSIIADLTRCDKEADGTSTILDHWSTVGHRQCKNEP